MKISSDPSFTPEQEILLWAIRVDHTKNQRISEIFRSGVDWVYLRETAIQHGIVPLLYKRLKGEMADLVPLDELSELRTFFVANAIKNIRMTQHLLKVLHLLMDSGVEVMPFKGPVLAVQAYGDLSLRSYSDLDILIHENDLFRVFQILSDQGYTLNATDNGYLLNNPVPTSLDRILNFIQKKDVHFFFHDDLLEVHWKIVERLYAVPLEMDQIWDRSLPFLINDEKVKTLSPEDMVIVLCFHGFKHAWQNLRWLADLIHTISNHPDLKWHNVLVQAENLGLKRIVLLGLFLARKHGGARCGIEFENLFTSDSTMLNLASEIQLGLFPCKTLEPSVIEPFIYLKSRERFKDKIMFLLNLSPRWTLKQIARIRTSPDNLLG
jgi:hypothetical protein